MGDQRQDRRGMYKNGRNIWAARQPQFTEPNWGAVDLDCCGVSLTVSPHSRYAERGRHGADCIDASWGGSSRGGSACYYMGPCLAATWRSKTVLAAADAKTVQGGAAAQARGPGRFMACQILGN